MMRHILTLLAALAIGCGPALWAEDPAPAPAPAPAATAPAAPTEAAPAAPAVVAEAAPAEAAPEPAAPTPLNSGDTAWMLMSVCLVLLMTIPGLFLFYGGLVRAKNALSVIMQCFAIVCMVTILWTIYGYSLAFSTANMAEHVLNFNSFFGGLDRAFAAGISLESMTLTIPESVFFTFQLTFAIITPALIVGAFAERMKFSTMMVFTALWLTLVYLPICHMVWSGPGGLMWDWGVLDFAGGTVVHINAGVAGLVAAIMLGKRKGYPQRPMPPHSMVLSVVGAALLWVGWFGFNAGSAVSAGQGSGMAMMVTQIATAMAGFAWMVCEWIRHGKPSALGIASGAVAGLVAITPAAGFVGPMGALAIGAVSGVVCYFAVAVVKRAAGYDDSLDAFGVHGVGGIVGAILTGVFASTAFGGFKEIESIATQVWLQIKGVGFTVIWCGVITAVILGVLKPLMGLRVTEEEEEQGLDLSQHGEEAYNNAN
ncbi:MAG: ammonium transporter [Planctomycetes bacterium]|nr:ammonium transporter [Planctomycetota bacterium]